MSRKLFNTHEALQMLEDKGFFTEADIGIPPAGEGDSDGEEDHDANHLSEKLLLAEVDVRIEYAQPGNNVSRTSPMILFWSRRHGP